MNHNKIVGIGFNKTGTTSLGIFLQQLNLGPVCNPIATRNFFHNQYNSIPAGDKQKLSKYKENNYNFPHRNMLVDAVNGDHINDILVMSKYFDSFEDRPWNTEAMYKAMNRAYPYAKFILTRRKPDTWWSSVSKWLQYKSKKDNQIFNQYMTHLGVTHFSQKEFIKAYSEYNFKAISYFKACSNGKLLIVDLEDANKASKIIEFLGLSRGVLEYPHENKLIN